MDLYKVQLRAWNDQISFVNTYSVVAETIIEAYEKAIKEMKERHKLQGVSVDVIKLIETGVIV